MKWFKFKKKEDTKGKYAEEVPILRKEFDVLNYTPVDYKLSAEYAQFMQKAEADFRNTIGKLPIDSLCSNMYDTYVKAVISQMKSWAKEQYTNHMYVINHHRGILQGDLTGANLHLENLMQDLKEIEEEIQIYTQLKKERNILL